MNRILLFTFAIIFTLQSCSKSDSGPNEIKLIELNLNKVEIILNPSETFQISATYSPENASNKELVWTSSDEKVATVSPDGKVTAIALGKAVITVSNTKYSKNTTANITVVQVPITAMNLPFTELSLKVGANQMVKVGTTPVEASQNNFKWISSDVSVATVTNEGLVTAVKAGIATITVSAEEGKITASYVLTVEPVIVSGITLNKQELTIKTSQKEQLIATISPSNATDTKLTWASSNNNIVTVDQSGNILAIAEGKAIITVKNSDGKISATSEITVVPLYKFAELNKAYKGTDGLTVTLKSFSVTKNEFGTYLYSISYTLLNETNDAIIEGTFKMHNLVKGIFENQYGFFGKFFPGEGTTRSYEFKSTEALGVLEYNGGFFSTIPGDETIKWAAPKI